MLIAFSLLMLATGITCLIVVLRGGKGALPTEGLDWMASGTSALLIVASGALLAMALSGISEDEEIVGGVDLDAPDFAFTMLEDEATAALSDYRGHVVLINFWATWCQPCIAELPELDKLQADLEESGLVVLTLSDEPQEDLIRFSDLLPERTLSGYFELGDMPPLYKVALAQGRPVSYVVDRAGTIRSYVVGAGNYDSFARMVRPLIRMGTAS